MSKCRRRFLNETSVLGAKIASFKNSRFVLKHLLINGGAVELFTSFFSLHIQGGSALWRSCLAYLFIALEKYFSYQICL